MRSSISTRLRLDFRYQIWSTAPGLINSISPCPSRGKMENSLCDLANPTPKIKLAKVFDERFALSHSSFARWDRILEIGAPHVYTWRKAGVHRKTLPHRRGLGTREFP